MFAQSLFTSLQKQSKGCTMPKPTSKSPRQSILGLKIASKRRNFRSRPMMESLEQRCVLSTFTVNTTLDTVAVNLRNGKDASGHISLRSAIMAADAHGGSNTIKLRS